MAYCSSLSKAKDFVLMGVSLWTLLWMPFFFAGFLTHVYEDDQDVRRRFEIYQWYCIVVDILLSLLYFVL